MVRDQQAGLRCVEPIKVRGMTTPFRKYKAFAYRQTDAPNAPWLILFVATAEDLLTWAGIPQRTDSNAGGFQRVDDPDRVQQTKEFFNLRPNQSPTALIVGIHKPVSEGRQIEVIFNSGQPRQDAPQPYDCELIVKADPSDLSIFDVIARLRAQFAERLKASPGEIEEPETDEEDDAVDTDEIDDDEKAFDVPHSVLHRLVEQLGNPAWVEENQQNLRELAKPATIIDGQHRIKGAAACERDIPFAVCALLDCSWAEQVFQFTVVNYSAKGIPDQFITANAALSLTEAELSDLQIRLDQAKVKVIEYDLMKVVQFDDRSPFYNLVNLTEDKADRTLIGYKTMIRVAKDWYTPIARPDVVPKVILPRLFPNEKSRRARVARWHEIWGEFFIDFWTAVRDHYQGHKTASDDDEGQAHSLWTVGESNLLIAIVLYEFQRCFFQDLSNQDDEYYEVPKNEDPIAYLRGRMRQRAQKFLGFYPADFFAAKWLTKSLNTSAGRKALSTALTRLLTSKGKYQYGKSALVTGEIG